MTREQFIAGLREAADFFEAHPELETPYSDITINVFADAKEDFIARAKAAGGQWQKKVNDEWYFLTRQIGCFTYDININRQQICRRVVVGTEVIPEQTVDKVEWICDEPLLTAEVR